MKSSQNSLAKLVSLREKNHSAAWRVFKRQALISTGTPKKKNLLPQTCPCVSTAQIKAHLLFVRADMVDMVSHETKGCVLNRVTYLFGLCDSNNTLKPGVEVITARDTQVWNESWYLRTVSEHESAETRRLSHFTQEAKNDWADIEFSRTLW